jgi:catechol 2,3-dioxygenase-like lactoylglutathione lyase family enzyme
MLSVYIVQLNVVGLQAGIKWYTDVLGFKVSAENNFLHHGTTVQLEHDQGFRLILHNARRPAKINGRGHAAHEGEGRRVHFLGARGDQCRPLRGLPRSLRQRA